MNYDTQTIKRLKPTPPQKVSAEAVELMGVMKLREQKTGQPVKQPGEIFACLLAMGYQRANESMDVQQRAKQFVGRVREELVKGNRRSPSYDQILQAMTSLGYTRPTEAKANPEARSEARAAQAQ